MAERATIARPYAEALFRVAAAGDPRAWSGLVSEMGQLAAVPEMRAAADDPKLSRAEVAGIFLSALKSSVTHEARELVGLLIANKRLALLPEIARQFHALRNASEGAADVEITSAFPLEGASMQDLVAALERRFGKRLRPRVTVDASLIGGVRARVGDEVLDTSVRARLAQMQSALTAASC